MVHEVRPDKTITFLPIWYIPGPAEPREAASMGIYKLTLTPPISSTPLPTYFKYFYQLCFSTEQGLIRGNYCLKILDL